jgi:hypothetical protein
VEIGGEDFGPPMAGFYQSEEFRSMYGRWTDGNSRIALPRLAAPETGTLTLVLNLAATRPAGFAPVALRIALDGIPAVAISNVTSDMREYRIPLSAATRQQLTAGPTVLSISSDVFVPKAAGMGDDGRRLGIFVDWVRVE